MLRKLVIGVVGVVAIALGITYLAGIGAFGSHEVPGEVTEALRPVEVVQAVTTARQLAAGAIGVSRPKQILFGDLHVHTTFSFDAFMLSLPLIRGEGAHPPADACDFARFCSALDFWSINDHAFSITPQHWRETVDSIRQCNAVGGGDGIPDTVAFLGWEWTQVGTRPEGHYGHKNVVLAHTDEARIPTRPIAALRGTGATPHALAIGAFALSQGGRMHDMARYFRERSTTPFCPEGVAVRDLPTDCIEQAATPEILFDKLDDWGHDAVVIPHGTTWGFYTPPGSSWDKQLVGEMHDPQRQTLIEIYSGHGDSEVYRDWRAVEFDADGNATCPPPSADYLPSCWRAGEIIRERCLAEGDSQAECEERAVVARRHAVDARVAFHRTVPGATGADFLDAGQCRDCDQPSFNYRPASSAQYIMALGNFDEEEASPRRFRMGIMASSDNHFARPGTGYKEVHRRGMTESIGGIPTGGPAGALAGPPPGEPLSHSQPFEWERPGFDVFEAERQASFFSTGGLIATHAEGRGRTAIWDAMARREVYGTTGPRILLWFDLLNPPGSRGTSVPMGSEVSMGAAPIFQVRAVGSFEQQPGCPDYAQQALSAERLDDVCMGECYNPSDRRRRISRIEIIRIRPQITPGEDVASLIEDPWLRFQCESDETGCAATFSDPEFSGKGRDTLYYARVYEEPTLAINADNVRCEPGPDGTCAEVSLCPGPDGDADQCLAAYEPRAWSSPIWVDFERPRQRLATLAQGSVATGSLASVAPPRGANEAVSQKRTRSPLPSTSAK